VALSRIDTASATIEFLRPWVGTRNDCVFRFMSMPSPHFGVGVLAGESVGFALGAAEPRRAACVILRGSRNRRGLRPPDLGEDRALRRLQPARREGRVVELRYPARCLPNRGAMAPALLFRSTGLDLLRYLKNFVLARLDLLAIRSYYFDRQRRQAISLGFL
jgi:hypothetical protein